MSPRCALIGFGEVGQIFAADLLAAGCERVSAYDIIFHDISGRERMRRALAGGIAATDSASEAVHGVDVVISAVTAAAAGDVARQIGPLLTRGQIFLDVNSASPTTKVNAAPEVEKFGAHFVEGAVMAAVPGPRLRAPILAGGAAAEQAANILNPLGMNITPVSDRLGRASAMKLCRSVMIKGLEALIVDCAAAASRWEVETEVFASLSATFPSIDWRELSVEMPKRVRKHGVRRAAEMREAAQMLEELGLSPDLSLAIADRQEAYAKTQGIAQ